MMKKVNIVMKAAHLWTQEEEDRLTTRIVDNFCDLINRSEEEGLYWTGLKCDLIDLAHMVWETGRLMDKCGRPMDFQTSYIISVGCFMCANPVTPHRSSHQSVPERM